MRVIVALLLTEQHTMMRAGSLNTSIAGGKGMEPQTGGDECPAASVSPSQCQSVSVSPIHEPSLHWRRDISVTNVNVHVDVKRWPERQLFVLIRTV